MLQRADAAADLAEALIAQAKHVRQAGAALRDAHRRISSADGLGLLRWRRTLFARDAAARRAGSRSA